MVNIFQWIVNLFKQWFNDPNFHGALPVATGGDTVYTPTITGDGNWLPYLSKPYEGQFYAFGDALDCVSQSGTHTIEAILNYFYKNNLFPVPSMKDLIEKNYLNEQGFVELSVPYIAKLAGTTRQGLPMDDFWHAVNTWGMVPKKNWNKDKAMSWDEYYQEPTQDVITAGEEFAKIFQWNWQVIENNNWNAPDLTKISGALKHSPIHFATVSCSRDANGIQRYCGVEKYQHARTLYSLDEYQEILDQYSPYLTKSEPSYPLACCVVAALKIT